MAYLLKTTEVYRVDDEPAAKQLIEEAKSDGYGVIKYSCDLHERKSKGEVIDSWYRVTLTRSFSDEKEPEGQTYITYVD